MARTAFRDPAAKTELRECRARLARMPLTVPMVSVVARENKVLLVPRASRA